MEKETTEEIWKKLKGTVSEAIVKKEVGWKRKEIGHKDWWDRSCTKKKRKVHRSLRKWRNGKVTREEYMIDKSNLRSFLDQKQKRWEDKEELEFRSLKNATEIGSLEVINK